VNTTATVLGLPFLLTKESGLQATLTLRAFKVREFNELLPLLGNEVALIEHALGVQRGSLAEGDDPVSPESYDELAGKFRELNRPFFSYCTRQTQLLNQVQGKTAERAMERALTAALERNLSSSGAGSSAPPLPPG
jgi:hypothetical protein